MNICLIAFALTLGCASGHDAGPAPGADRPVAGDHWLAEDKLRHFTLSFAATQMAYGGARFTLGPEPAVAAAATAAFALGVAKELRDARAGGPFSLKDLAWDAGGVALGVALTSRIR